MQKKILVTGSSGLIGSEAVLHFGNQGYDLVGVDNNMRKFFFGEKGDTSWMLRNLKEKVKNFSHMDLDIRDRQGVFDLFRKHEFGAIVHCAAQPSHDWAKNDPLTDFEVNALGTLNLLEATRKHCPAAPFVFMSTNKVYGDSPNYLPLKELKTRWDYSNKEHFEGVDESLSIDRSKHSVFGASKVAADIMVQEYGRYFDMNTVCFRGGCLTGPQHSVVFNLGGGRENSVSILECFDILKRMAGKEVNYAYNEQNREGDHICYISNLRKLKKEYPSWRITKDRDTIFKEMVGAELAKIV